MTISFNGKSCEITEGTTLYTLLSRDDLTRFGIAVALNQEVIRRNDWDTVKVQDGDRVEVIQAVQGG